MTYMVVLQLQFHVVRDIDHRARSNVIAVRKGLSLLKWTVIEISSLGFAHCTYSSTVNGKGAQQSVTHSPLMHIYVPWYIWYTCSVISDKRGNDPNMHYSYQASLQNLDCTCTGLTIPCSFFPSPFPACQPIFCSILFPILSPPIPALVGSSYL